VNAVTSIFLSSLSLVGTYALRDFLHLTTVKKTAFEKAKELSNGKGIVNIGAGPHRTYQAQIIAESPSVMANIDIAPNGMRTSNASLGLVVAAISLSTCSDSRYPFRSLIGVTCVIL